MVQREDRVKPPPEAAQHHRPWPMQMLLQLGPDAGGIDADEFEAALQIVETFKVLTCALGERAVASSTGERLNVGIGHDMSDRDAERCACWFDWAARLPRGLPARLVAWIEDEERIGSVAMLRYACRAWDRVRGDRGRPVNSAIDNTHPIVLPMRPSRVPQAGLSADPLKLPVQTFCPSSGGLAYATRSVATGAPNACQRDALPATRPPAPRR